MKDFLVKLCVFLLIPAMLLVGAAFWMPVTPKAKNSLLFEQLAKDSLIKSVQSLRLVMIGGSNLSMSIDSKKLQDSLHLHPVNMGLHAAQGLVFMLDHTLPHIKRGDVVLVVPEYTQLYGNFAYGDKELLLTLLDVKAGSFSQLGWKQIKNAASFIPKYAFAKFKPSEYKVDPTLTLDLKKVFNNYGDYEIRFDSVTNSQTYEKLGDPFNDDVIERMQSFEKAVNAKGAKIIVSFPAYQEASYINSAPMIKDVEKAFRAHFTVVGTPEQYKFPNELMYDTPYHLNKKGVALRTEMLIKDLQTQIK